MNMKRTPLKYYLLMIFLGLLGGVCVVTASERWQFNMLRAPWIVSALMLLGGIVIVLMARQVHKYAKGDRKDMDPQFAVNTLLLSKALGIACSFLLGWYGGQVLMCLNHLEAPYYSRIILECSIAAAVCCIDVVFGAVGEWLCQLPPKDGPESPQKRQQFTDSRRYTAASESNC